MAEVSIPITAGSGTNIEAFQLPNGNYEQVVAIGDGATNGRIAGVTSGSELQVREPDTTTTGNITAASTVAQQVQGAFVSSSLAANSSVSTVVNSTAVVAVFWSGNSAGNTLVFEGTYDGTYWTPVPLIVAATGDRVFSSTAATFGGKILAGGFSAIRVRSLAAWTAGTTSVTMRGTDSPILTSQSEPGRLVDGPRASYSAMPLGAGNSGITTVSGDTMVLIGSASKIVRLTRVAVSLTSSGSSLEGNVQLIKRSALDASGTSATFAGVVPHDSADPAASAVVKTYSVAPGTPGTAVGYVRSQFCYIPATTSPPVIMPAFTWEFTAPGLKQPTLRSATECLALNFANIAAENAMLLFEWTEDDR